MNEYSDTVSIACISIPHVGNPGLSRNIAIRTLVPPIVRFVAFMDGDDLYACRDAIESLVTSLAENPGQIAAFGDYDWIRTDGTPLAPPSGIAKGIRSGQWHWRKRRELTWSNLAEGNVGVFHLQCLMVRVGAPYLPYRPRGED